MESCENCKHKAIPGYYYPCYMCDALSEYVAVEKAADIRTNADRIRAMSDEELAGWLTEFGVEIYTAGVIKVPALMTKEERFDWLKQPAE